MNSSLYHTLAWRRLRHQVLRRDGNRCTVARLLGGDCSGTLHVHHLQPPSQGGITLPATDQLITVCAVHHPLVEKVRRAVLDAQKPVEPVWKRCPHKHVTAESRRQCEERLNRVKVAS